MKYLLVFAANYLLGSIPSAFLVGKLLKGIDIREYGSGNVGATNAFRVLGKWAGLAVLVADCLKGVIGVLLARAVGGPWFAVFSSLAVMAGHNFPIFLKLRGGKGVATGAGILLAMAPKTVLLAVLVFIAVVALSKYVSLGSIIAALTVPIIMMFLKEPLPVRILGLLAVTFVVIRHIPNIKRLLAGTENKITDRMR